MLYVSQPAGERLFVLEKVGGTRTPVSGITVLQNMIITRFIPNQGFVSPDAECRQMLRDQILAIALVARTHPRPRRAEQVHP